jgi:hypothetical protein
MPLSCVENFQNSVEQERAGKQEVSSTLLFGRARRYVSMDAMSNTLFLAKVPLAFDDIKHTMNVAYLMLLIFKYFFAMLIDLTLHDPCVTQPQYFSDLL